MNLPSHSFEIGMATYESQGFVTTTAIHIEVASVRDYHMTDQSLIPL